MYCCNDMQTGIGKLNIMMKAMMMAIVQVTHSPSLLSLFFLFPLLTLLISFFSLTMKKISVLYKHIGLNIDNPQRQYHTLGRKSVRSKKHLSTAGSPVSKTVSSTMPSSRRPVNPWMPEAKPALSKRQSTATLRSEKALIDLPCSSPPLPSLALKPDKMKKSETFYAKFVKTVLSPSRKQYYPPQELVYR